jgi:four helix bundle protein
MKEFNFERLIAWQKARMLSKEIYLLTHDFPKEELYAITSQIRRSAVSIACNLAEGSSRLHKKDAARFYEIAYSSAIELLNLIIISKDFCWINEESYNDIRGKISELSFMINHLHTSKLKSS